MEGFVIFELFHGFLILNTILMNSILLFLSGLGFNEILLIGLVVLVFFGAKKIPEFMKGLGKGVREFKSGIKDVQDEVNVTKDEVDLKEK